MTRESGNTDKLTRRAAPGGDATDRRTGVGGLLRASRLRCGEELEAIAQVLRIRPRHLQAIEEGHFDQLPGTTYAVGFIRAYADYLGLDAEEVVRRFKDEQTIPSGRPPKADLVFPSPMSETGIPRGAVVFLGVVIGLIAYGGWYVSTVDNDFFKKWIEPVPARLAAMLPGGAEGGNENPVDTRAEAPATETTSAETSQETTGASITTPAPEQVEATTAEATQETTQSAPETPAATVTQGQPEPPTTPSEPEKTEAVEATPSQAVTETPDATPAPEPAKPEPVTETAHTPEAIAQPVETAALPAPTAAPAQASNEAASEAAAEATKPADAAEQAATAARHA